MKKVTKQIFSMLTPNTQIHRPRCISTVIYVSEDRIIYSIGQIGNRGTITFDEFDKVFKELSINKSVRHTWHKENTQHSHPCNFYAIGAILVKYEIASYNAIDKCYDLKTRSKKSSA